MWEVFKFLLLCLFFAFLATLIDSVLYKCVLFIIISVVFYDFDSTIGLERHAINKFKGAYLKVRNFCSTISQSKQEDISSYIYTPTMNSINKQSSSFELSKFNKSGNGLSPITNSPNSSVLSARRLIQARQTSTPLTKTSPWQRNSPQSTSSTLRSPNYHASMLNRSARYSLASVSSSPKLENMESSRPTIQTVTGPLLASTRFNINLGTYTDTKSPGLVNRVVQYNNESSGEQYSTHQTKYGSPGQFPIVQLYKKELPILTRTPRKCTVRIAPPDPVLCNSDQANTILRDNFVQNNIDKSSKQREDTEINTKSVLEALKEISRKRIHTNDDLNDISKRQRKNSSSSSNNLDPLNKDGKRTREDTPPKPKDNTSISSSNNTSKRVCVVNEIESSLSSSKYLRIHQGQKRKSSLNSFKNKKQRRLSNGEYISRETQTVTINGVKSKTAATNINNNNKISTAAQTETEKPMDNFTDVQIILESTRRKNNADKNTIRAIDEANSTLEFQENTSNSTKILFSETPLEIMKQNKLTAMLSALSGQKAELIPLPVVTLTSLKKKAEAEKVDGAEPREIVSILSPKNKPKHDKHVTFSIPNTETDSKCDTNAGITSSEANNPPSLSFTIPTTSISFNPLTTKTIISSPLQFPSALNSPPSTSNNISVPQSNFNFTSAITATSMPSSSNNISFGPVTTTTVSTNIITSCMESKEKLTASPTITFGVPNNSLNSSGFNLLKAPNFGGLASSTIAEKSDTNKTNLNSIQSGSPTVSSNPMATLTTSTHSFGTSTTTTTNNNLQPTISFGVTKTSAFTVPVTNTGINFGSTTGQQPLTFLPNSNELTPTTTTSSTTNLFNFNTKTDNKSTTAPSFNFIAAATNQTQTKTGGFKFELGKNVISTPSSSTAEAKKTFGSTSNFNFGAINTTTSAPTNNTSVATTTASSLFTTRITSSNTDNSVFTNTPTTIAVFGATTTGTNIFNTTNTTSASKVALGINTTTSSITGNLFTAGTTSNVTDNSTFSTPSITASSTSVFGTPNTNASGIFGAANATPAFGTTNNKNENPLPFGTFGNANSTQNPPSFGAFTTPTTTQSSSSFGNFGAATTTQSNTFSAVPATTSGAFTFGANASTKPFTFGPASAVATTTATAATTTSSTIFGATTPAVTTANIFGRNTNSAFGNTTVTPNAFGTTTTTAQSTFGQGSSGGFGTASTSNFGSTAGNSAFGGTNNNNNSSFGSSGAPPAMFGSTNQPPNTFGTGTSNVFGVNNNANQPGSGLFGSTSTNANNSFGSNTNASTFGTAINNNNNNTTAPNFGNFGSPVTQTPVAQSSGVFAFGTSAPSAAPTPSGSNAFQFGTAAQTPKLGGFNFSAGNSANINFGSGATPSFNSSPAPAFGSPSQSGFNAPAPATGMFNIGSGSTAPKQRLMIKARRRN